MNEGRHNNAVTGLMALGIYEPGSADLCLENTGRKAMTATNRLTEAARKNTLDRPSLSPRNPETSGPASIQTAYTA